MTTGDSSPALYICMPVSLIFILVTAILLSTSRFTLTSALPPRCFIGWIPAIKLHVVAIKMNYLLVKVLVACLLGGALVAGGWKACL